MLPLANDLGVGFDQIVGDVSSGQVLEGVFVTDLYLDVHTTKNVKSVSSCACMYLILTLILSFCRW